MGVMTVGLTALLVEVVSLSAVAAAGLLVIRLGGTGLDWLLLATLAIAGIWLMAVLAALCFDRIGFSYPSRWHLVAGILLASLAVRLAAAVMLAGISNSASWAVWPLLVFALLLFILVAGVAVDGVRYLSLPLAQGAVLLAASLLGLSAAMYLPEQKTSSQIERRQLIEQMENDGLSPEDQKMVLRPQAP